MRKIILRYFKEQLFSNMQSFAKVWDPVVSKTLLHFNLLEEVIHGRFFVCPKNALYFKQELTLGTVLGIIYDVRLADLSILSDDKLVKIHIFHSVYLQVPYI